MIDGVIRALNPTYKNLACNCEFGCADGACKPEEQEFFDVEETETASDTTETTYTCSGTAKSCSSYSVQDCKNHPGCSEKRFFFWAWCDGIPKSCSSYTNQVSCESHDCNWR